MKKFLNSLLLIFLLSSTAYSQSYLEYVVESTRNSDLIVEGHIESAEAYQAENGRIFTKNHLAIRQTLKGNGLQGESVTVVTPGGKVGGTEDICSHCTELNVGEDGLFFLKTTDGRYTLLNGNSGKVHRVNIGEMKQGVVPSLRKYVPDWEMLLTSVKRIAAGETVTQSDLEPADTELCYKIDSIKILDERHISAKVYAKSNTPNLKFGGGEISIKYATDALGSYLVQNNLLAVTAGDFVSNSSVYSISPVDLSADEFKLAVETGCTSGLTYAVLGTSYEEIAELVLELDISQAGELLNGTEITDAKGKYFDQQSTSGCSDFRRICLEGEVFVAACSDMEVEIIGTPGAGIGSMAKITGDGFKDSPGKLKIPDADTDIDDGIVLENIGAVLLSWSDDLIEVDITAMNPPGTMGSGLWIVDPSGLNLNCTDEVDIKFSLQQGTVTDTDENGNSTQVSKHVRRYSLNSLQGAITYYLDNTIDANSDLTNQGLTFAKIEMLVKEALCHWEEKTGISINYLGGIDPATWMNTADGLNVIYFTDAATVLSISMGTHAAAATTLTIESVPGCTEEVPGSPNNAIIKYPIAKDSRTAVNQERDWYDKNSGQSIGSNDTDMYTMFLHEIGHALGLDHALDPEQGTSDSRAMYPFFPDGDDNKHSIDDGDEMGGEYLAQKSRELLQSSNLITTACINDYALNDTKFCTLTSVSEFNQEIELFSVTPNICSINQQVIVKNETNYPIDFIVSNALGAQVNSLQIGSYATSTLEFPNSGVYFISAAYEGQLFTQKIIVQQ